MCSGLGSVFNPNGANTNALGCSPSNIGACAVGDLSSKLGTISVNSNPIGGTINAWTDGNLHSYDINRLSVGIRVSNNGQDFLACTNIVELTATSAIVNTDRALMTMSQQSPFDPTMINVDTSIPTAASYQITRDGNVRDGGNMRCYSNSVYQPFEPFQTNATSDAYAVGDLSAKHTITGGAVLSDKILPLTNLYSALGHNLMVTPSDGSSAMCGTVGFKSGSNVRIVRASAGFNSDTMTGYVNLVSNTQPWPLGHLKHCFLDANIHKVKHSIHSWTNSDVLAVKIQCC